VSLTFDESLQKLMSNYLVAVNRLRHAQQRGSSMEEPDVLREFARAEDEAEIACCVALAQRGWTPPHALNRRPA